MFTDTAVTCEPIVRWRKAKPTATGRPPLLVLLHGRGADENDLFELGPGIDPRFAIASVRAPIALDEGGYTWSESRSPGRYRAESLRASATWMQTWLDTLKGGRDEPQPIYLLGFSAGMAMAAALLLDQPARYSGAVLLSGTLPFDTDLSITMNSLAGANVFYAHGSFDRVIPAELVSRSEKYLRGGSGAHLTARRYPIAHEVSLAELQDVDAWLAKLAQER